MSELRIVRGDCLAVLPTIPEASIDAIVTDPPYALGFMGKAWDSTGIAFSVDLWREALRVLRPGGHLLSFGGTRTYHRMACSIEDAGFEIRDSLLWLYGTGFPKSLNIGDGRGTALKPAHEPIVMARKPLIGTVAANVLAHGTGGINVDACRIGTNDGLVRPQGQPVNCMGARRPGVSRTQEPTGGRWPANVLLDEEAARMLDEQSGTLHTHAGKWKGGAGGGNQIYGSFGKLEGEYSPGDSGGASRFFYVAKASRAEREAGCESLPLRTAGEATDREDGSAGLNSPRAGAGRTSGARNHHPTVKPVALIRYLVRLVTPPGGLVLDPFAGSGSTGVACAAEGVRFVGIELEPDYVDIAQARLAYALERRA